MKSRIKNITLILIFATFSVTAQTWKTIAPNDSRIKLTGGKFSKLDEQMIDFQRHSDSLLALTIPQALFNPVKAKTTTGIILYFKTASPVIKAHFRKLPGTHRKGVIAIYKNGELFDSFTINANTDSSFVVTINNSSSGETLYKLTMPTWNNLAFTGLEIIDDYDLINFSLPQKPVYVAFGNSITHGSGQFGTHQTYAYQVAEKFGWELNNVAVGGAKTSPALAAMLRDDFETIDYITILAGYNDYAGEGTDTNTYKRRYNTVLDFIRAAHPETKIFCITPTFARRYYSQTSGLPITDFRTALANLVTQRQNLGDENLYLIRGEEITSYANLHDSTQSNDPVHFTVEGAALFADSLSRAIERLIPVTGAEENDFGYGKTRKKAELKISIYPNPSEGEVEYSTNFEVNAINVYNILGENVGKFSNAEKLRFNDLPKGIYFLRFTSKKGTYGIRKIVLN